MRCIIPWLQLQSRGWTDTNLPSALCSSLPLADVSRFHDGRQLPNVVQDAAVLPRACTSSCVSADPAKGPGHPNDVLQERRRTFPERLEYCRGSCLSDLLSKAGHPHHQRYSRHQATCHPSRPRGFASTPQARATQTDHECSPAALCQEKAERVRECGLAWERGMRVRDGGCLHGKATEMGMQSTGRRRSVSDACSQSAGLWQSRRESGRGVKSGASINECMRE